MRLIFAILVIISTIVGFIFSYKFAYYKINNFLESSSMSSSSILARIK